MSAINRRLQYVALAWIQICFLIVMPVLSILSNAAVIGWTYDFSRDRLHYKWLIADIALNLLACISYL